jgi:hypothetical protein
VFADAGTRDPLLGDSRRLKAAVERHGGTCTLHIAPGEIHGYDALVWREAAREKWQRMHEFLAPHMVRAPEPARSGIVPAMSGVDAACDDDADDLESRAKIA